MKTKTKLETVLPQPEAKRVRRAAKDNEQSVSAYIRFVLKSAEVKTAISTPAGNSPGDLQPAKEENSEESRLD